MRQKARKGWVIPYLKSNFLLLMCTLISPSNTALPMLQNVKDVHELCRANRHLYELRENNSFQLHLRTDGITSANKKMVLRKLKTKCTMTLKVCSACHVSVVIQSMDIPSCSGNCSSCSYFELREPLSNYKTERFCGDKRNDILYFESKTKIVHFDFVQSLHEKFYVSFDVTVKRNLYLYIEKRSEPKYIETPYFPFGYPSDYEAEYNFQVLSPYGYVQLLFVDFQLSQGSYIEVSGHNGTRVEIFDGKIFRPPVFISRARYLRLVFRANHQPSSLGFRAMYKFGRNMGEFPIMKPNTDCGGIKDGYGGAIKLQVLMSTKEIYDCIWLISPPLFLHQSALLAASISRFRNIETQSTLEFRKGLTSKADVVNVHQCRQSENCSLELENSEVMVQAENGFYIRFRGSLNTDSYLLINYYTFQEDNCSESDFMCHNGKRCINTVLVCDGFYHCLDQSDENDCEVMRNSTKIGQIFKSEPTPVTNNVYNNVSSDKTFIILTSFGAIAVIGFFICSIGIVYVLYQKYMNFVESRSHSRQRRNAVISSSEEADDTSSVSCIITEDLPPSYEDVLMDDSRYPSPCYINPEFQETHLDAEFSHQIHNVCYESSRSDECFDSVFSEGISVHINQVNGDERTINLCSNSLSSNLNLVSIDSHGKNTDHITYNIGWNDVSSSSGPSGFSSHSEVTVETYHESIFQIYAKQSFSDFIYSSTDKLLSRKKNFVKKQSRDKAYSF